MLLSDDPLLLGTARAGDLDAIFEAIDEAIVQIDADWRVLYANDVYLRFARMTRSEVIGRTPFEFAPGFKRTIFYEPVLRCQQEHKETRQISYSPFLSIWVRVRVVPYQSGSVLMISRASEDSVKDHLRSERAQKDELTGLGNRLALEDRAGLLLRRHAPFALVLIGLNDLKPVRDSHGYAAADMALLQVASRLSSEMQEGEWLARISTDEFAAVLFCEPGSLAHRTEDLLAVIRQPIDLPNARVVLRAAAGCVDAAYEARDFETLLKRSSLALAAARRHASRSSGEGPALCAYRAELELESRLQTLLQDDLRMALDGQQYLLHLQPKVSLASGRVIGAEALIRWAHPRRGLLTPGHFLTAAREIGAMPALDRWTLQATAQMARALRAGGRAIPVSMNLGVGTLGDPTLPERCRLVLDTLELEPQLLEIEIPEGALVEDIEASTNILQRLHHMGVRLSIDDFGTGYSSFAYLARFPVQTLKIDRSLVTEIEHSKPHRKIVQGIVKLAHHLGMEVVAEGVETAGQADVLRRMQCDAIQGYVFAQPMPLEDFVRFVDGHPTASLPDPRSI
jgi:diguanylate cyclase (GGDEF)-like protein